MTTTHVERIQIGEGSELANEITDPSTTGADLPIGSWWLQDGSYPTRPTALYLKASAGAGPTNWVQQNLLHLQIFNVRDFGALGDGVTNDRLAIQATINAAAAAGGGAVYFPATSNFYNIVRSTAPGSASIDLLTITTSGIILFGDGYASKIRQTGSSILSDSVMLNINNNASRVRIFDLYFDNGAITSPDPVQQNHGVECQGKNAAGVGPTDVEIVGCYFGGFVGDAVRFLAELGKDVSDVRIVACAFDLKTNLVTGSRTGISVQRFTHRIIAHYNWLTGSHDQEIDFEPTGYVVDSGAPSEFSILANHFVHDNLANCVTLTASGGIPAHRNLFSYNILKDGDIHGGRMDKCVLVGNMSTYALNSNPDLLLLLESGDTGVIASNIFILEPGAQVQACIQFAAQSGFASSRYLVADNICEAFGQSPTSGLCIGGTGASQITCDGNICVMSSSIAGSAAIALQSASGFAAKLCSIVGCMSLSIGGTSLLSAFSFGAVTTNLTNTSAYCNYMSGPTTSGVRWPITAPGSLGTWIGCGGNNGPGVTGQMFAIGGAGQLSCTLDGSAGPAPQICGLTNALTEGKAIATIGSLALNNGAGQRVLSWKESGTGVSGGATGWAGYGGTDVVMGAALGSTATTARFFAPGGMDLAAESTIEIQWIAPRDGKLKNARLACVGGTGGGTNTYVVRKNGVNTTLTVNVLNGSSSAADTTHIVNVAKGDLISLQVTKTVAPTTPQSNIQLAIEFL